MGWRRNRELLIEAALELAVLAMLGVWGGWRFLIGGAALIALHWLFTLRRYAVLRRFTRTLDRVLHGAEQLNWAQYEEGELAVLQSAVRKLVEQLRHRAEALRSERAEMADFLADISHQLRTPLTSINLLLAMEGKGTEEERAENMRALHNQLRRMDWLIEALLKMSRLDSPAVQMRRESVAAADLIRKAAAGVAVPMELRGQTLDLRIEEGLTLETDPVWTAEALGNILKNCMEHTPHGGVLTVEACGNPLYTELRISDTGPGIHPADLPHLFERFYRGQGASEQSAGIGLSLARMIAARQNGTLKAENRPEGGARFVMRLYKEVI